MVDARFFTNCGPFTLSDIAAFTGAQLSAPELEKKPMSDVAPLDRAGSSDVSFLDNTKYLDSFAGSKAGACFIRIKFADTAPKGMALLISENPYRCYALTAQRFYPYVPGNHNIAPGAVIDSSAALGKNVTVEHGAVIGKNVIIGDDCIIGANTVIHAGVTIGHHTRVGALSSLSHCLIGSHVVIHRGVHIGQDGFGFAMGRDGHVKVPQLGRVVVEDDVEIGSGSCIDRGTGPDTVIGEGTKIDNLVQIAHNVHIGKRVVIAAQTGIAGSTRIGDGTVFGGQVGVSGHLKVGPGAKLAAKAGVMQDVPSGLAVGGFPAIAIKDWHRQTVAIARLIKSRRDDNE